MLFVFVESFGQRDSLSEERVYKLLEEKGWSLSSSTTPGDIQLDDNRVELFPDFYFNNFAKSIEFKKSRIKYPLTYLVFDQNEVIDNWDKIQKDSLIDLGKQFVVSS